MVLPNSLNLDKQDNAIRNECKDIFSPETNHKLFAVFLYSPMIFWMHSEAYVDMVIEKRLKLLCILCVGWHFTQINPFK